MENQSEQPAENRPSDPKKNDVVKTTTEKTTSFVQYSGIAFQMLGTIGLGVWAGLKLDEWQDNRRPIWTIVLSLVAIGASLYLFIRQLTQTK
ncbi:AtpZ/AtpI family protein [Spirosoma taeanense]|uniref:AtpZ/AtpI family protein n=1 Tax=Spirosoma taeanense TaxID=2735870 RepID=A0A6M5Y2Q2_9BACT|nr:AtpZ/AtpI family protein [Spirosoma taeanense]QJW88908.1 AtpZ/AtpI family protein [Spirosoma taeanense]